MSEPATEVVIPSSSAGIHDHPHTHQEFEHHDHPDIRAEIVAVQTARDAESVALLAAVAAESSEEAAVGAEIEAAEARTEIEVLREEMQAGFAELRNQIAVVPVAQATLPGDAPVEEPEPEPRRSPPKKKSAWF
jgi:hypothetical protein